MLSRRYTIVVADRTTGEVRRLTVSLKIVAAAAAFAFGLPLAMGVGARLSVSSELARLRATNEALGVENESFRAATGELTTQIAALQDVVTDLGRRAATDPTTAAAIRQLPALVRSQAMGGAASPPAAARTALSPALVSPESTFGVLRDLLGSLESSLRLVRGDVERWQALTRATPSIWPAVGWLTDRFGTRSDPFTGEPRHHGGLDISADRGQPVRATADGAISTASFSGDFGNLVVVEHEFGLTTRYAHLSRITVKAGDRVSRGDVVGLIGATGRASGPHLHYEVWANGRPLNPLKLLTQSPRR